MVTQVSDLQEILSKYGNIIPRKTVTLTCPSSIDETPDSRIFAENRFSTITLSLWYKDASDLTIQEADVVVVTKCQIVEFKGMACGCLLYLL